MKFKSGRVAEWQCLNGGTSEMLSCVDRRDLAPGGLKSPKNIQGQLGAPVVAERS